jgi:hypothetical protein
VGIQARATDYNFEIGSPSVTGERTGTSQAQTASRTPFRPPDAAGIADFLQLLARAVQQYHTYPATSPMCRQAVEACQRSLVQIRRDQLMFRVAPHEIIADDLPLGHGTLIGTELARRLHVAAIAQVTIDQAVSLRELSHFAQDLIACSTRLRDDSGLIERLAEHGVDRISLRPAYSPEVLPVAAPAAPVAMLLTDQRQRREQNLAAGGHVDHLYPPDKGWVRVDPSAALPSVSLVDLALLAGEPSALADMLVRLTDDEPADGSSGQALSQKFSDVAMLFSALDPRIARVMFSKLARAVLDLDTERRQALLRRTILPSLLDGRIDATVLQDFPDVDLAESLCLLLDLETAAPEVVTTALSKLNLDSEREARMLPLIEQQMKGRRGGRNEEEGLDAHARRLIKVDRERGRCFAEFSAFDLSLDDEAVRNLGEIREGIAATDVTVDQLSCIWRLTRLEPNPETVQGFMGRAESLVSQLEHGQRWSDVAVWLEHFRELSTNLREPRPDVADAIEARLAGLCTASQASRLVELADRDEAGRAVAGRMVGALGPAIGPALLAALQTKGAAGRDTRKTGAIQILCDHAKLVAPALAAAVGQVDDALARIIARVLGLAGFGFEPVLGQLLASRDEQTVRESLRSLARIGTARAASLVAAQVQTARDWRAAAAEQTLWHFPPNEAQREVRTLLSHKDFVIKQPVVATRLLDRLAQSGTSGLEALLRTHAPLQYRFWNPALMRFGRRAKALLNQ